MEHLLHLRHLLLYILRFLLRDVHAHLLLSGVVWVFHHQRLVEALLLLRRSALGWG
jgi:hypothetical protein